MKSLFSVLAQEAGHLEFEAILGNSLANMARYQSALKRDLYRAIETLRKVQAERREGESDARHESDKLQRSRLTWTGDHRAMDQLERLLRKSRAEA